MDKKLSIIIVNYNCGTYLEKCMRSVYNNLKRYPDFEILIIDNGSYDKSLSIFETQFPGARFLKNEKNLGFVKAANQGIKNTSGKYLLFLNPDTELLDENISLMVDFMDKDVSRGISGPLILSESGSPQSSPHSKFNNIFSELKFSIGLQFLNKLFSEKEYTRPSECDYILGSAMLIRRAVFDDIGLFDENIFMFAEEEDLCLRAKQRDWKIFFYPNCKIVHYGRKSSLGLEKARIINHRMAALYYYSKKYNRFFMILIRMMFLTNILMHIIGLGLRIIVFPKQTKNSLKRIDGNFQAALLVLKMKDSRNFRMA